MRLVLVCISLRGGGTERIVCRLANHLAQRHHVTIVVLVAGECFYELDSRVSVRSATHGRKLGKLLRVACQVHHLASVLRSIESDACLIFGEDIAGAAVVCGRMARVPVIWAFLRGTPDRSLRGANGILNPLLLRLTNRIVVQTRAARDRLAATYPMENAVIWPNPIEVPKSASLMGDRERIILSVGSIGRLKNQEALLRAFAKLEHRAGWRLVIVGDGPKRMALSRMADDLGIADSVSFEGERQDVPTYIDRSSIFAFTSLSEGFPNVLAEAMAGGCACISYDCLAGPSELIKHGVNGILIPVGDEDRFAAALQKLVNDAGLRVRLASAARKRMQEFKSEVLIKRLEEEICKDVGALTRRS